MKIVITGCNGLLGSNLCDHFAAKGHEVVGFWHSNRPARAIGRSIQCDLLDAPKILRLMETEKPNAVINCVGLVNIDQCETDPELARRINADTAANIAHAAKAIQSRLIHISTDHLFDGRHSYYTEEDPATPINAYGKSKLEGEHRVLSEHADSLIVRTNFYGWSPAGHAPTFAEWLYQSLRDHRPIRLIKDYYFNSLEVHCLSEALEALLASAASGILNVVSSQRVSKYDFGVAMAETFGLRLQNVSAAFLKDHPFHVPRPPDLSLSTVKFERLMGYRPAGLVEGLHRLQRALPPSVIS